MVGVCLFTNHWSVVNFVVGVGSLYFMWLVEENTNHGVLFLAEHLPGRKAN
jgi:hypothetical protein